MLESQSGSPKIDSSLVSNKNMSKVHPSCGWVLVQVT